MKLSVLWSLVSKTKVHSKNINVSWKMSYFITQNMIIWIFYTLKKIQLYSPWFLYFSKVNVCTISPTKLYNCHFLELKKNVSSTVQSKHGQGECNKIQTSKSRYSLLKIKFPGVQIKISRGWSSNWSFIDLWAGLPGILTMYVDVFCRLSLKIFGPTWKIYNFHTTAQVLLFFENQE